jgi:hypothetical protein
MLQTDTQKHGNAKIVDFLNLPNITVEESHIFEDYFNVINDSSLVSNNNMADMRI